MKIFAASLITETNTFVSSPTGWGGFREYGIFYGDASERDPQGTGVCMAELRRLLAAGGHELVESVTAFAQPFGRTVREVYESLRDQILADLAAAGPVDGVLLLLHGAMVADGYDDCEGDLLKRARNLVGPEVPIGAELDLHCHFTELMQRSADVIICYKEYPHIDLLERLRELTRIVLDAAQGRVRPVTAVFDCKMVGVWHTTRDPLASFVRRMQSFERRPGVLSVSLGHGFPWGDVPEAGAKLWVVTDNDPLLAASVADELGREFWALRDRTGTPLLSIEAALEQAREIEDGPVVLADIADNAGGGAMGDSTFILRAVLERSIASVAMAAFWDLGAIQICRAAGVGARIDLRLGGKCGPTSGDPVDLPVTVMAIADSFAQPGLNGAGALSPLGASVWVQGANQLDIVLVSVRSQVFSPGVFTGLGIELTNKKLIVVKSMQHFYAQFASLAKAVFYVTTPGAMNVDFANLPYRVRSLRYWPRVANPHAASMPARERAPKLAAPGELFEVDGLRLHLQRSGPAPSSASQPTIVIEAGAGCASPIYARLQRSLAAKYPVCSYDRPGMGWSEADSEPLDAVRNGRRLRGLLSAAGITGPIVLIGHSLGGLLARAYTGQYPEQVVGLAMLDASHPDQFATVGAVPFRERVAIERDKRLQFSEGGPPPPEVVSIGAIYADMPDVVQQLVANFTPESMDAMALEVDGLLQVARQAGAVGDLGDRPLKVLWAAPKPAPGFEGAAEVGALWPGYQHANAALSTRGSSLEVAGSDHMTLVMLPPFVARIAEEVDRLMAQLDQDH